MNLIKSVLGLMLVASTSFAGGGTIGSDSVQLKHLCKGVLTMYRSDQEKELHVYMDFQNMMITVSVDDVDYKYEVYSSRRTDSYMPGTQFIDAQKVSGPVMADERIRIKMPFTNYYREELSHLSFINSSNNSSSGGYLQCDHILYDGPSQYGQK